MTIPRVRWSKKQRQYIPGVVRLTESGIPIDAQGIGTRRTGPICMRR